MPYVKNVYIFISKKNTKNNCFLYGILATLQRAFIHDYFCHFEWGFLYELFYKFLSINFSNF